MLEIMFLIAAGVVAANLAPHLIPAPIEVVPPPTMRSLGFVPTTARPVILPEYDPSAFWLYPDWGDDPKSPFWMRPMAKEQPRRNAEIGQKYSAMLFTDCSSQTYSGFYYSDGETLPIRGRAGPPGDEGFYRPSTELQPWRHYINIAPYSHPFCALPLDYQDGLLEYHGLPPRNG